MFDTVISTVGEVLFLVVIVDAFLSFVMPPNAPLREALGRVLQPMYAPIRRFMPQTGGFDFSPIVLIVLIQLVVLVLTSLF